MTVTVVRMSNHGFTVLLEIGFLLVVGAAPLLEDVNVTPLTTVLNVFEETTDENRDEHGERVHLAAWNYEYVAIPLDISLFVLLAGLVKIAFHHLPYLSTYVPESCVLIVIGTIMGAIFYYAAAVPDSFRLEYKTFMLYMLPPIVLEASYSLNDRTFSQNLGAILLYAVVGTVLNFLIIGFSMYGMNAAGAMGLSEPLDMLQFLLFASFIVAVDPVAVLAIFQDIGVHKTLYFLVFGESLLNDAVTIVLYNMMKAFNAAALIEIDEIFIGIGSFFTVSLGGLAIGIIFGIISTLLTRVTSHVRVVEPLAILIMAYLSYLAADLFDWSGIISMIGCGIVQAQYALHNISRKSKITVHYFIKMLSSTCDSIIFLFLGLELVRTNHVWNTGFVLWAVFFCLVARLVSVFGLTFLVNLQHKSNPVKLKEQFIMWYGGLRGAICFALCSTVDADPEIKNMFLTSSFVIILFTVFFQGITMRPLVKHCKIMMDTEESTHLLKELQNLMTTSMTSSIEIVAGQPGQTSFHMWMYKMNEKYFKRWLQKKPMTDEQQFLELYRQVSLQYYESIINGVPVPIPILPATPLILKDGTISLYQDVNNAKKEELAGQVTSELQDQRKSKVQMHRLLSRAGLGSTAFSHDRDLRYHDVDELDGSVLYRQMQEDIRASTFNLNQGFSESTNDSMIGSIYHMNSMPAGSSSFMPSTPVFLTPPPLAWHLMQQRTMSIPSTKVSTESLDGDFHLKKATSVLELSEAQDRMILPNLANSTAVQRKLKRKIPKRSNSATAEQTSDSRRLRRELPAHDFSKRLMTLGEEQMETKEVIDKEEEEEQKKHGTFVNEFLVDVTNGTTAGESTYEDLVDNMTPL